MKTGIYYSPIFFKTQEQIPLIFTNISFLSLNRYGIFYSLVIQWVRFFEGRLNVSMHELSITQSILKISLEAASQQGATRIRAIRLRMGPFSGVVPECVQMYLDVLAKGTRAEGAKIEVGKPSP